MEKENNQMTQEELMKQFEELREKAKVYIYKVMFDGEYSPEEYEKRLALAQSDKSKLYTDYSDEMFNINMEHLIQGYSSFGKDFLTAVISQDLDSAVAMFESAVQNVLDLTAQIDAFQKTLTDAVALKKEQESKQKENS